MRSSPPSSRSARDPVGEAPGEHSLSPLTYGEERSHALCKARLGSALTIYSPGERDLPGGLAAAAVFVPLCIVDGELSVLLIRRGHGLRQHRGEMAFPGGMPEPEDQDLLATAVRETQEELGVAADRIEPWGMLAREETYTSGYVLTPFTGWLERPDDLRPCGREVAEVVTVPLRPLADGELDRAETRLTPQGFVDRPAYAYNGRVVWGATARILSQLVACLRGL